MHIGIFSKTFVRDSVDAVFAAIAAHGYRGTQFNFASAGLPSLPEHIAEATLTAIVQARDRHGLTIEAVSATFNMVHPRQSVIDAGLRSLAAIAAAAQRLACPLVTLCTGTLDPDDQWRHHPGNQSPAVWAKLLDSMEKALSIADRHAVCLGIEPELANSVDCPDKARLLLDSLKSPRLRIVFDPANLFTTVASMDEQHDIVTRAIAALGPDIAVAHAKDRDANGGFVTAGRGVLDYDWYLSQLRRHGFAGCVIAHGLAEDDAAYVAAFLADRLAAMPPAGKSQG